MTLSSRVHSSSIVQHEPLSIGWEFCGIEAGRARAPQELAELTLQWLPATVPCTAASALRDLKHWTLASPARDFDSQDWWYRVKLTASRPAADERLLLRFDGLATVADVWLNHELILHSENMFRAHEVDIGEQLQPDNELLIRFHSLNTLLTAKRPRPRWKVPMLVNQQLRWFRTTLLGRTPGWSPPAAAVGPWRGVYLERRTSWHISDVQIQTSLEDNHGTLRVTGKFASLGATLRPEHCEICLQRNAKSYRAALQWNETGERFEARLTLASPDLWWPHTHGEPALYRVSLDMRVADHASEATRIELGHTGFRTVKVDTGNRDFKIIVNNVPIFCRGACWTPLDVVSLNHDQANLSAAFDQLCDAGMNMLRVGGTMVYESTAFLDLCDARGVLLWQDLMFANMDYPESDAGFVDNLSVELQQQLQRLCGRPSLAVLCGNSEGEQQAAMFGATRDRWQPALFHQTIPALVKQVCPDIAYWPSSAHGGSFPHQNNAGTTSYYGVGAYLRPLDDARRSELRFATECLAFANVPEDSTLAQMPNGLGIKVHHPHWKARVPRDLGAGWDFDDVRDHYLTQLFGKQALDIRYADHERYLELSRVVSGEVMAATFAEWRRQRSSCNGALIWFLRDFWPGAGWGVIDSQGVPKAAYYYLRRALQPYALSLSDEGCNGIDVHAANETQDPLNATIAIAVYRQGETLVTNSQRACTIAARDTVEIPLLDWFDGFMDLSYAYRFGPAGHDLIVATLHDQDHHTLAEHFYFKHEFAVETELGLTATARVLENGDATLVLQSRRFARSVTIQCDGFTAVDQYFHVAPGGSRVVALKRTGTQTSVNGTVRALNAVNTTKIGTAT